MKKLFALIAIVAASVFTFTPTTAEAGNYKSKVIGKCGGCGGHIHSYYRPVRLPCGSVRYQWIPSYHQNCYRRRPSCDSGYVPYRRHYTPRYNYGYRGGSGISIHFGGGRSYCR